MERINRRIPEPKFINDGNDTHILLNKFARLE